MPRITLVVLAAFWSIGASPCISDDAGGGQAKFSVKCVLSAGEAIRPKSQKVVIEEGVETDIGIVSTITSDGGFEEKLNRSTAKESRGTV